jgi:polyisoprenoid-binding protein YceI
MNKLITALTLSASALIFASCEDPAANKTKAITGEASPAVNAAAGQAPAPAGLDLSKLEIRGTRLDVTPENSKVEFTGSKVTGKHEGGFKTFRGVIDLVNDKPAESSVAVEIDAASVFTDADGLTKHLQTGDFFEVEKYPKAWFRSTKIVPDAGEADKYTVTGDPELRGVRKAVTFPATIKVGADDVAVNAEFSINRKDFGILYAGKADDLIRDDVVLRLDLKTPKKK